MCSSDLVERGLQAFVVDPHINPLPQFLGRLLPRLGLGIGLAGRAFISPGVSILSDLDLNPNRRGPGLDDLQHRTAASVDVGPINDDRLDHSPQFDNRHGLSGSWFITLSRGRSTPSRQNQNPGSPNNTTR